MTYEAHKDQYLQKVIRRYAEACNEKAFQGTIPRGESDEAFEAYEAGDVELKQARFLLEKCIERRVNK
jgi:hypothetical protein